MPRLTISRCLPDHGRPIRPFHSLASASSKSLTGVFYTKPCQENGRPTLGWKSPTTMVVRADSSTNRSLPVSTDGVYRIPREAAAACLADQSASRPTSHARLFRHSTTTDTTPKQGSGGRSIAGRSARAPRKPRTSWNNPRATEHSIADRPSGDHLPRVLSSWPKRFVKYRSFKYDDKPNALPRLPQRDTVMHS